MKRIHLLLISLLLSGCSTMKIDDFSGAEPTLDLFQYFNGRSAAWGLFEDRFGNVRRQFTVDIAGHVEGDRLTLDEKFQYADGETASRVWRIDRTGDNTYRGSAADIVGKAIGQSRGNALNWTYTMDLSVGDSVWRVKFDDWMFLQPNGVLINRAKVKKWGIEIGSVTLLFRRVET